MLRENLLDPYTGRNVKLFVIHFWSEQVLLEYKTVRAYFLSLNIFIKSLCRKNDLKDVITTSGYMCM